MPSSLSIFSAELQAILLVTQHITQNSLQCGVICSNSLSGIQALSSTGRSHHPIVNAIRETVSCQQFTLKLIWTPSHHGIPSNELPNSPANESAKWQPAPLEPSPASDFMYTLRKYVSQDWNAYWRNLPEDNKLRHVKPVPSLRRPPTPIFRKLEIFLRSLSLDCIDATLLHLLTNQPAPACPH